MKVFLCLLTIIISSICFGTNITLAENQYLKDNQRNMILCNMPLTHINFNNNYITINIEGEEYKVIDAVKKLEVGRKYTLISANDSTIRPSIFFTELPLVDINSPYEIVDTPKVFSTITIIDKNGSNTTSNAGIEYRGASSQQYSKKSFEIEFWNDNNGDKTQDFSLLGMREDKDWNLQALYTEPLKIRSTTAWEIWEQMSRISYIDKEPKAKSGIATQYVEVFLNNTYIGVFALSEKIDRKQLKLKKNSDTKIKGELYKATDWTTANYYEILNFDNQSKTWGGYDYKYPKDIIDWSNLYNLHQFVMTTNDEDFNSLYTEKYDIDNLVDYYIFLNILNAVDNTAKNTYLAKYDANGKYFYIPWDLDTILGRNTDSSLLNETDQLLTNGLYDRLWKDKRKNGFRKNLSLRWEELRNELITPDNIMQMIIEKSNYLKTQGVYKRDQLVNPGSTIDSEAEELAYIREWLIKRIDYLDTKFDFTPEISPNYTSYTNQNIIFYPNPAKNYIYFLDKNSKTNYSSDIIIYSMDGKKVRSVSNHSFKNSLYIGDLQKGTYIISFEEKSKKKDSKKLIIN